MRPLCEGGFGALFLARQKSLDRLAAVKLLLAHTLEDAQQVSRFLNEARITASIAHPGVVRIFDHGADCGVPWIAYEYVPGRSLRRILEDGALAVEVAAHATLQVAAALDAAHALGILHRDVKPDNVLEAEQGIYKLADFGISKWTRDGAVKTADGLILGTPAYIAPELVTGGEASPASDVYALGVMLFELVTGELPYSAQSIELLFTRSTRGPVPLPSRRRPDLPASLDRIVAKAMARTPRDRYAPAGAMAKDLEILLAGQSPIARKTVAVHLPSAHKLPQTDASTVILSAPPAHPPHPAHPPLPAVARWRMLAAALLILTISAWLIARHPHGASSAPAPGFAVSTANGVTPDVAVDDTPSHPALAATPAGADPSEDVFTDAPQVPRFEPGHFTGNWVSYLGLLPQLKAGGETARRATEKLTRGSGLEFGKVPALWMHWLELSRWLQGPSGPWTGGAAGTAEPWMVDLDAQQSLSRLAPPLTAQLVVDAFDLVYAAPRDSRPWLLLGQVLEMDGRAVQARTAYQMGLETLGSDRIAAKSPLVWAGLARALLLLRGKDALDQEFKTHVSKEQVSDEIFYGLGLALLLGEKDASMYIRALDAFNHDSRIGGESFYYRGNLRVDPPHNPQGIDPQGELNTWTTGLARFPNCVILRESVIRFHLERGDATAARTVIEGFGHPGLWTLLLNVLTASNLEGKDAPDLRRADCPAIEQQSLPAFRLLEEGNFERAVQRARTLDQLQLPEPASSSVAYTLLARGAALKWPAHYLDEHLLGHRFDWREWSIASGDLAGTDGQPIMRRALAGARERWPGSPGPELAEALWLSRCGEHARAIAALQRLSANPRWQARLPADAVCEILGRPIWAVALGRTASTASARIARGSSGPGQDPLSQAYWRSLAAADYDRAADVAGQLFTREPVRPIWSLSLVWNAARRKDGPGLARALDRARIAFRFNKQGLWPLAELALLEKYFSPPTLDRSTQ